MLLHREKSPDTNLHPFLFSNTEVLKHKKEIDLFGLILVVIQMCLICFPFNDDTRGKDTEAWDTSSCNGPISGGRRVTISGEVDPTQEALIRAKPNLIHPRDANALNAIDYRALRHTERACEALPQKKHDTRLRYMQYTLSFVWQQFPAKAAPHTYHFLNCPTLQTLPFKDWQKYRT